MRTVGIAAAALMIAALSPVAAALSVGAARVDITPSERSLPKGFEGINDPIFVRAIIIDDGRTRAALVTVDAGALSTDIWSQVSEHAQADLKIPRERTKEKRAAGGMRPFFIW